MLTEDELQCVAEEVNRKGKYEELVENLEMTSHLQGDITTRDLLQRWQSDMQRFDIHIKSHLIHHLRCIDQNDTAKRYCAQLVIIIDVMLYCVILQA